MVNPYLDQEASEVVPDWPNGQQEASGTGAHGVTRHADAGFQGVAVLAETGNSQKPLMHKGCKRGAEGSATPVVIPSPEYAETGVAGGLAAGAALEGDGGGGDGEGSPGRTEV